MPDSDQAPGVNSPQEELVVRLVSIDYYMTRPVPGLDECYSQLEGTTIEQVPVIRIFGCTPSGQKTCVHVHGVSMAGTATSRLASASAINIDMLVTRQCFLDSPTSRDHLMYGDLLQAFPYLYVPIESSLPETTSEGTLPYLHLKLFLERETIALGNMQ